MLWEDRCGMRKHKGRTRLRQRNGSAKLTPYAFSQTSSRCWFASWLPPAARSLLRRPSRPTLSASFPIFPCLPDAKFVSRAGSEDALQLTLYTPAQAARVVEYYRDVLSQGKWRLVSDMKKPDGTIVLYAEQDGPPLWVSVWPTTDSAGTMVQLAGAVVRSRFGEGRSRGAEGGRQLGRIRS